jgi:hypothetical protein
MSVNSFHYVNYAVMGEIIQLDLSAFPNNPKCGMLFRSQAPNELGNLSATNTL